MPSLQHRIAVSVVKATKMKRHFASEAGVCTSVEKSRPTDGRRRAVPKSIASNFAVTTSTTAGFPIVQIAPHGTPTFAMVWIHGGAYVGELQSVHWRFAAWAARTLSCTVHVPLYPLAPEHTWRDTIPSLTTYCDGLAAADRLVLAGDSAGGGLALAVAQRLSAAGGGKAAALVLISPWLDVTTDDAAIRALDAKDPMLAVDGLLAAGKMWAGADDPAAPEVSPINGEMAGLPPTLVQTGTADVLNLDAHRFTVAARAAGVEVQLQEEVGLLHDYPLFPIPEGRRALRQIETFLRSTLG